MTHEEKINYFKIAAGICHFGFNNEQADLLISLYDGILKKSGNFSVLDAATIQSEVKSRERIRITEELLNKVSEKTNQ